MSLKKRNKTPIKSAMGELQTRNIYKGKSRNKLLGYWRPVQRSAPRDLSIDYSHR